MMGERHNVWERGYFSPYSLEGEDFDAIKARFGEMLDGFRSEHPGCRCRVKLEWTGREYDDGYKFAFFHERDETDAEYDQRMRQEQEQRARQEAHDLREFERLRKKFKA